MRKFSADELRKMCIDIFTACGSPPDEAEIVADELVTASLMGFESHGLMRCLQYTEEVMNHRLFPGAPAVIVKETATTVVVDCGLNFGQISANRMVDIVCEKAKQANVACAVSVRCQHVGRLGSYVQKLAERGFIAIATVNSAKLGHWVAPWGGREGRLATNPIAFSAPTSGRPMVLDMSTSMIAEGKIRILKNQGMPLPRGSVSDANGDLTIDPNQFYGPPRGNILPFGADQGYKGFGLSLLVEILGSTLAGAEITDAYEYVNGLCLIAINPDAFCGQEHFLRLMDSLCNYITSCPPAPGYNEVMIPGTLDFRIQETRLREGISLDEETRSMLVQAASNVGIILDMDLNGEKLCR